MATPPSNVRTPDELRTLYTLNDATRDVVVEGREDAHMIRWYLSEHDVDVPVVYAIRDRAYIDGDLVTELDEDLGERGRVVALASVAAAWELDSPALTCLIDADRDCLTESDPIPGLLRTDFGALENYSFRPKPLQKLLSLVLGLDHDSEEVIERLTPALNDLFVVRFALHKSGLGVACVPSFTDSLQTTDKGLRLDTSDVLKRSLNRAQLGLGELPRLYEAYTSAREKLPEDRLIAVRGHDIAPVLIESLGLKNRFADPAVLEHAMRGCLEIAEMDQFPMFQDLLERVG